MTACRSSTATASDSFGQMRAAPGRWLRAGFGHVSRVGAGDAVSTAGAVGSGEFSARFSAAAQCQLPSYFDVYKCLEAAF